MYASKVSLSNYNKIESNNEKEWDDNIRKGELM
jgi:hypothetical protein